MSITLEHVVLPSPEQMDFIIEGMRNSRNSWDMSDTNIDLDSYSLENVELGENDHSLMQGLSEAGTEHRKYMRMMPVYVRITAPLYWWKEFDTYKVGTVENSCSTMYKIAGKEFMMEDFSTEHLLGWNDDFTAYCVIDYSHTPDGYPSGKVPIDILNSTIKMLNEARTLYLDWDNVDDEEKSILGAHGFLTKKDIWWQMIQLLPSSYNQTRNVMVNYEVLANIYRQRKNHKLDEWREFCNWIKTLPYQKLITGEEVTMCDNCKKQYEECHCDCTREYEKVDNT